MERLQGVGLPLAVVSEEQVEARAQLHALRGQVAETLELQAADDQRTASEGTQMRMGMTTQV